MRIIIDRTIVILLILFALYHARHLAQEQFHIEPIMSNLDSGGKNIGLSFFPIIIAFIYQTLIAKSYSMKVHDTLVVIIIFGLVCVPMVRLNLQWAGALIILIATIGMTFLASSRNEIKSENEARKNFQKNK